MPTMYISVDSVPSSVDFDYQCVKKADRMCQIQINHKPKPNQSLYITIIGNVNLCFQSLLDIYIFFLEIETDLSFSYTNFLV